MAKKQKDYPNAKAFQDAARALECDESEERFDAALKKVAAHKPPKEKPENEAKPAQFPKSD